MDAGIVCSIFKVS